MRLSAHTRVEGLFSISSIINGMADSPIATIDWKSAFSIIALVEDKNNVFFCQFIKWLWNLYLLKKNALETLEESILLIKDGGSPITPIIANKIINYFKLKEENEIANDEISNLNSREIQVLNYISEGLLNKEIAEKIFLSVDSIKKITQAIYEKLQVRNRSEAIKKFLNQKKK